MQEPLHIDLGISDFWAHWKMTDDKISSALGYLFLAVVAWLIFFGGWHSKLRYSLEYGVHYDQVRTGQKPHDCDWETAPLGKKNCHYEAEVMTLIRTSVGREGQPIVSYDDGKTWVLNNMSPPAEPSVMMFWNKVQD
jgi:hypothetical protein